MFDIEKIGRNVERLDEEKTRERYLNKAGLKDNPNISAIYQKYGHLFTKQMFDEINKRRQVVSGDEEKRLRYIGEFIATNLLLFGVKEWIDQLSAIETKEVVTIDRQPILYRDCLLKVLNQPDRNLRQKISHGIDRVIDCSLNPIYLRIIGGYHERARKLGYPSYKSLYEDLKGFNFDFLLVLMQDFLAKTESIYENNMEEKIGQMIGIDLSETHRHDIEFLFRGRKFDSYFPRQNLRGTLKKTLSGMGIDLDNQKNIELDIEPRPKKILRAACFSIRTPDEIKVLMNPMGGFRDYLNLLHEAGHAEHNGNTKRELCPEYRILGDNSIGETYALLFEDLMLDPSWLMRYVTRQDMNDFIDLSYLYKLYSIRRYVAKLEYEMKLHGTDNLEKMPDIYRNTLEKALIFKHSALQFLQDVDDAFYVTGYLRAWVFESQLRASLKERFGNKWYERTESGEFLKQLWSHGHKYGVDELAQQLGYSGLDITPLINELEDHFS